MARCFEPREIAAALDLPDGHPGRRHLDACPRCRSLALAYFEFMEGPAPGDVDFGSADADLQRRLARAFGGAPADRRPWWRLDWPRPVWGTLAVALAAAAVLLTAGDLGRIRDGDLPAAGGAVRGEDPAVGLEATSGPRGLVVTWAAVPEAEQAVVVLYDGRMRRLGTRTTPAARLAIPPDDPLAGAAYCQLLHVAAGDTIARSAIVAPRPARE